MNIALKLTLLFCLVTFSLVTTPLLSQSNLSSGTIYKLSVPESGIYSISPAFINTNMGDIVNNIDPNRIQIFCGGGGTLPRLNSKSTINDPIEIPLYVTGSGDGSFDDSDRIYFYVPGPENYELDGDIVALTANIYDQSNYIYIKFNEETGKRIQNQQSLGSSERDLISRTIIHRHEIEKENLLGSNPGTHGSGQQWFGEAFANQWDQDFSQYFTEVNPLPGTNSDVRAVFAGRSASQTTVEYNIDGQTFTSFLSSTNLGNGEARFANSRTLSESLDLDPAPSITISYKPSESTDKAWLDFIQIVTEEEIGLDNNELLYHVDSKNNSSAGWTLNGLGQKQLWDVTDFSETRSCGVEGNKFHFNTDNRVKTFRIFDESGSFPSPEFVSEVANQNIKGLNNFDYLIVYHKDFKEAADLFAEHRSNIDALRIEMVDINHVYNEFASGRKDPTAIRDMARVLQNQNESLKFMMLLGDSSYDYRDIVENLPRTNYVPSYQTSESLSPVEGFPFDDYFAMLSPNEGENFAGALDLNVGRLPARSSQEALDMVNKIIHYDTSPTQYNDWKLNILYSADDEDNNRHINDADDIATHHRPLPTRL